MRLAFPLVTGLALVAACGSSSSHGQPGGGDGGPEAGADTGPATEGGGEAGAPAKIEHVVVLIQENHTFDSYFSNWCTGATGSNPTCTSGPSCCEKGPGIDASSGTTPEVLDDTTNAAFDPNHTQACELTEIDGGKMDGYVSSTTCGNAKNFAYADTTLQPYWDLAGQGALGDHYFQPVVGQSSSNDMYFARAQYVFLDNTYEPEAIGAACTINKSTIQYTDPTIADLLETAGVTWAFYSEGYAAMQQAVASGGCPTVVPSDCAFDSDAFDCAYDPSDNPFAYYKSTVDDPAHFKDYASFATDLAGGTLPAVSFIKALDYKTEHPGYGNLITAGIAFVQGALSSIQGSSAAPNTLILLTWDEGGGLFDHVAPPAASAIDHQPYGTRIPVIALGPLARAGTISHVQMEHSSIVKFIESQWLGSTGQLAGRDTVVANIGSLLDPKLGVPEN
ncbi:MAG TPA: alkaline phosphatase family protein [Polyangiaceae bacterium]|jgi:phospholipase C